MITRKDTIKVNAGGVEIGGGSPISIQSMTNTKTTNIEETLAQIGALEKAGCQIVRLAVPDMESAEAIKSIKAKSNLPIVVDVHFDYRLALASIEAGCDKVRINPGNIGEFSRVKAVADACKARGIPIRIGVNGGSLENEILSKYGHVCADALVESALYHTGLLEKCDFYDTVISLKASNVPIMIEAYEKISEKCQYPLHLGVTEAGTLKNGMIKSSLGIGALLAHGIGDTIRVSLTADPVEEIYVAKDILSFMELRTGSAMMISCPTCARCNINLIPIANEIEQYIKDIQKPITVAIMGCAVNGPGEAREADIGIAGGNGEALLFKKGEIVTKAPQSEIVAILKREIDLL